MSVKCLGIHYVLDLKGCYRIAINSEEKVIEILKHAALMADTKIFSINSHKFSPQGVSGLIGIEESHLSMHTWPELGEVTADFYTCGDRIKSLKAVKYIIRECGACRWKMRVIFRGEYDWDSNRDEVLYGHIDESGKTIVRRG